jgi:Ca2+-binding EF-hand superfamily protein
LLHDSSFGVTLGDLRDFMKVNGGFYPMERDLQLVFERFDKDEDGIIDLKEFIAGLSPFMNNKN